MAPLSLYAAGAVFLLVLLAPIARAAPAFVATPGPEIAEDDQQTVLNPTRVPRKPEIHHFHVDASITARFANTLINSMLINPEEYPQEAIFSVVLPEDAFISKFVMVIEDVAYEAEVKEKATAQREYDAARERGQTAGQVKLHDTKPNTFSVSVNVAAYSSVLFNLTYQELLHRRQGVIGYRLNLNPGQIIGSMKVDVHITEPQGLQEMDAMWLPTGQASSSNDVSHILQNVIHMDKLSQFRAHIQFHPTKDQQKMESTAGIVGNLLVQYDVLHDLSAGNLQVMNGYFVHYFSPEGLAPAHKNVVFVIDVSGSMGGSKIKQTKEAMGTILKDIREGDRLNIVTFTDDINIWQTDGLVDRAEDTINDALQFVGELRGLGGTNLHSGVMTAVDLLKTAILVDRQNQREAFSMIIMLTDGVPSSGVTNLYQIRTDVLAAIDGQLSLFCLGFGQDLDHNFLDNMASENQGVARRIYTDSSAPLQLKGFYDEVATPLLVNVNIEYNHINVDSTTQTRFLSYFEGTEIIVAGQLSQEITVLEGGVTELVATVSANSMDTFIELETTANMQTPHAAVLSNYTVDDFCQRLWAYLTIKSILKSMKIARTRQEKDDLKARALELSMRYHFVTPLTSLLVVRPDDVNEAPLPIEGDEDTAEDFAHDSPPNSAARIVGPPNRRTSYSSSSSSTTGSGGRGGGGGGGGGFADSDPHFVVHVPASDVSVCFDILGHAGEVFNLLTDTELGIQVYGFIVAARKPVPETGGHIRTYFGRIGVRLPGGHTVSLSTSDVVIDGNMVLSWRNTVTVHRGNWSVAVRNKEVMLTTNEGDVRLAFISHLMNPDIAFKADHLGFYIINHEGLTDGVHGLIGQFQRRQVHIKAPPSKATEDGQIAELTIMDRRVRVVQRSRMNSLIGRNQQCWFVGSNANGLIDGKHTDYLVPLKMMP